MTDISQGDIVKISGFKSLFLVVSNNAFIQSTGYFHVCPVLKKEEGALHIFIKGLKGTEGVAVCEQLKLIDPAARGCTRVERLLYEDNMNISDAIQGIFEYD